MAMKEHKSAELMLPQDYINQATCLADSATKQIHLVSLSIIRDPATNTFIDSVLKASQRGIKVHVAADFLTFVYTFSGHWLRLFTGRDTNIAEKLRREFKKSGAKFCWLGKQYVPFLFGRTHSKWTVIDDDVFTFGGVNIEKAGIQDRVDYMFHIHDHKLANLLVNEQHKIEKADPISRMLKNHSVKTDYGTVLLDSGQIGKSIIYDHAIKLAQESKSIIFVSQYCPSGALGRALSQTDAKVYFNHKDNASKINKVMIGSRKMLGQQHNLYNHPRYLHAKFIIGTLPDGTKRAITGSHNFATAGAHAGTREIALETTDSQIISQLENFYNQYIK